ncbi:lactonase family protein [Consotaella aegiceratis]|uniref:lactonase family protein n=1 Tax=Consotaella aegiceratis TaxID=3097961 RepID=UPI002F40B076
MAEQGRSLIAYVGSYAGPTGPADAGIRIYAVDPDTGSMVPVSSTMPQMEAGFLCCSPDGNFLYGVDERKNDGRGPVGPEASVKAFAVGSDDGRLSLLNSQTAFGAFPTYVSVDPKRRWVVTASHGSFEHVERIVRTASGFQIEHLYDDSTLALYPVSENGELEPACDVWVFEGHGKDPSDSVQVGRHPQASPHAHSATFDPAGRFILVCEKSADKIYTFAIDERAAKFSRPRIYSVPPGSAPRHPVFHPSKPFVFVTNEMASTVSSYRYDSATGALAHIETVRTIFSEMAGNAPADCQIHPSGRLLLVNNRGVDNLASFEIDEVSGRLSFRDSYPLAESLHPGVAARSFAFDPSGRYVFAADRPANAILTLAVEVSTGRLSRVSTTPVPRPGFILVKQTNVR